MLLSLQPGEDWDGRIKAHKTFEGFTKAFRKPTENSPVFSGSIFFLLKIYIPPFPWNVFVAWAAVGIALAKALLVRAFLIPFTWRPQEERPYHPLQLLRAARNLGLPLNLQLSPIYSLFFTSNHFLPLKLFIFPWHRVWDGNPTRASMPFPWPRLHPPNLLYFYSTRVALIYKISEVGMERFLFQTSFTLNQPQGKK